MSKKDFFLQRPEANPTIYAYKLSNDTSRTGQLIIGFTTRQTIKIPLKNIIIFRKQIPVSFLKIHPLQALK
jgi:hypothetical protein